MAFRGQLSNLLSRSTSVLAAPRSIPSHRNVPVAREFTALASSRSIPATPDSLFTREHSAFATSRSSTPSLASCLSTPANSLRVLSTAPSSLADAGASTAITSSGSAPGALPVTYIDDYHNHPHRFMKGDPTKRAFTYMILGTTKFIAASAARVLILKLIYTMSASADVLAAGSVEVELDGIPEGQCATIKWRGKPVFIKHRTSDEILKAEADDVLELRDPETDSDRCEKKDWLVVLGVCTHLGCVPIANAGDYYGWFCPCHGSHYDLSGRIRKGPAPLNLEVPSYRFIENDTKLILG